MKKPCFLFIALFLANISLAQTPQEVLLRGNVKITGSRIRTDTSAMLLQAAKHIDFAPVIRIPRITSEAQLDTQQTMGWMGDTLKLYTPNDGIIGISFGGANGTVLKKVGNLWISRADSVGMGGGGGGGGTSLLITLQDGSFANYPDSATAFDSNFTASQTIPWQVKIGLKQGLTPLSSTLFYQTTLSHALVIKNGGGKLATFIHSPGFFDPIYNIPNLNGSFTLATIDGNQDFSAATWHAGTVVANGPITSVGASSPLTIAGTGSSTIAGSLGLGGAFPGANQIFDTQGQTSTTTDWRATFYGTLFPTLSFRRAENTFASPTYTQAGDFLGEMRFYGYDPTNGFASNPGARMLAVTTENYTVSAHGTAFKFFTTPNGATTSIERIRLDQDGSLDFFKSPFYTSFVMPTLTAGRTDTIPDQSGQLVVAATAPLSISNGTMSIDLHTTTGYVLAATDSAWIPIAGFDSTQGWVGQPTYIDNRLGHGGPQVPLGTFNVRYHPNGIGVNANYDWIIDSVKISILYKLKQ